MKIGLFPGSFNPVHIGHLIISRHFLNFYPLDQIWFIISPQNPLKKKSSLTDSQHRLEMVRLSIEGSRDLLASDIEFHLPLPSFTINTIDYLKKNHPEHEFSLIIGSDNYQAFEKWKSHDRLIGENQVYIYPRKGSTISTPLSSTNFLLTAAPELEISSTSIRNLWIEGKNVQFLVPESVLQYIQKNKLYRS